eukprot:g4392.t1
MAAAAAAHSVYNMNEFVKPNFGDLGKPTITVDVARLQTELRALHQRIEVLEVAAVVAAEEREKEQDQDGSGSSACGGAGAAVGVSTEMSRHADELDGGSIAEDSTAGTNGESHSPLYRSATGLRKKGAAANAALHAEVRELSERLDVLASSSKRREKAQSVREKASTLARSMEIKRIQLAIDSRVTSDDLQLAVSAIDDKIVAVQSSVDSALSDRFRRMQDVVHEQMASLLSMVQALTQQHGKGSHVPGSHVIMRGLNSAAGDDDGGDGSDSDEEEEEERAAFDRAVAEVVNRIMQEEEKKMGNRGGGVQNAAFDSLQEDYETFKELMEEKADRQDAISSALEGAQTRLDDAEANIAALTEELEHSAQETREAMDVSGERLSELDAQLLAAASVAADATRECAAIRVMVGETRREVQAEAKQDAEGIAGRAEGRVKAEVNRARGDARAATENLASELKRYIKRAEDEAEGYQAAIAGIRALSEKAMSGATAAATRAEESDALLQKAETRIGKRLDGAIQNQTSVSEDTLERVAAGELEVARVESELRRLLASNGADIDNLRAAQTQQGESSERALQDLRAEVQDSLITSILEDPHETSSAGTRSGGGVTFGNHGGSSRHSNNNGRPSLLSLGAALRRQNEDTASKVLTLQRSGVGTVTVLRKMEAAVHALSTKDLFWKAVDTKLAAHQRAVSDMCLQVEGATVTKRSRITLSKEAQACLAGDMQRVAKLMAVKADYEVIRELAKLEGPEQAGQDWDVRVEFLRQTQMRKFLNDCREALDKMAPEARTNFNGEEIRGKFLGKLSDSLRVALSKFSPTTPGATLFGKIKLKAKSCLACDRPFTPSATGRPGPTPPGGIVGAAVEPDGLPEENSHITKDTFRPHTSHGRLGSPSRSSSVELFEPQHTSIHSVMSGGRSSPESPHVYRGGFKLPKHLKSPLHLPGEGEDGIGHASPLLHKCPSMTGLDSYNEGRPSTSGGVRRKRRPPSNNHPSSPATDGGERTIAGGLDGGGSIVSAFTMITNGTNGTTGGAGGGRDGFLMGFGDGGGGDRGEGDRGRSGVRGGGGGGRDAGERGGSGPAISGGESGQTLPYYAASHTLSRPSTPHEGSVRLLT